MEIITELLKAFKQTLIIFGFLKDPEDKRPTSTAE